jgi:3-methylcrotonyl-CoA carboxylase alpha subunit
MCAAAVRLAEAVNYRGAGTVEFIVDGARPLGEDTFWFLEMNTRLQVEHPVTEMITGLDLVGLQLEVAAQQGLSLGQDDIAMTGHAIEARICAEDPGDGFRPGAGRIEAFGPLEAPDAGAMRWETGFEPGDRVPGDYDSMLAKLVVHGPDRDTAIDRLAAALSHTQLVGVPGNVGFLGRCIVSEAFGEGEHHVNWIAQTGAALTDPPVENRAAALAAVADILMQAPDGSPDPWDARDGWRLNAPPRRQIRLETAGELFEVSPDAPVPAEAPIPLVTDLGAQRFAVTAAGESYLVIVPDFEAEAEALEAGDAIKAPMPGRILSLSVEAGAAVSKGETLVVMEAMKMEHALSAPREGVVESVSVSVGDSVSDGTVLVALLSEG